MNQPVPAPAPKPFYLTFVGPINYPATKSLRSVLNTAILQGATEITLLLSSFGGSTQEGFALYNILRGLPVPIVTHNIAAVESIANVVFLAGNKRYACPTSRFFNHDLSWTFGTETLTRPVIAERQLSLNKDAEQMTKLVLERTKLSAKQLQEMGFFEKPVSISPAEAKSHGIIDDVQDVKIPSGATIWNVEY